MNIRLIIMIPGNAKKNTISRISSILWLFLFSIFVSTKTKTKTIKTIENLAGSNLIIVICFNWIAKTCSITKISKAKYRIFSKVISSSVIRLLFIMFRMQRVSNPKRSQNVMVVRHVGLEGEVITALKWVLPSTAVL